jgi:hypothetical protein
MTLAPTNEAIRRENHAEKIFYKEKDYRHDLGGHLKYNNTITIKRV